MEEPIYIVTQCNIIGKREFLSSTISVSNAFATLMSPLEMKKPKKTEFTSK